jgi:hypothetical protein
MAVSQDDRGVGLGLLFGILAVGAAGYGLQASFRGAVAAGDAAALQMEAAVGFAAAMTFGTLLVAVLHIYE